MGRPKNFSREDVLEKAVELFWRQGFADTSLQDLEKATGVNKSGLYTEFKDKDDIYLASLRHYLLNRDASALLADPPGLGNIATFLKDMLACPGGQKGCLAVNSMRELAVLPSEAKEIINRSQTILKRGFARNIAIDKSAEEAEMLAEIVMTFFVGLSLEQNLSSKRATNMRKIDDLIALLKKP